MAMPPPSFLRRTISSVRMGSRWQKMGGSGGLVDEEEQEEEEGAGGGAPAGRPRQSGCTRCRGAGCGAEKWFHFVRKYPYKYEVNPLRTGKGDGPKQK